MQTKSVVTTAAVVAAAGAASAYLFNRYGRKVYLCTIVVLFARVCEPLSTPRVPPQYPTQSMQQLSGFPRAANTNEMIKLFVAQTSAAANGTPES